MRLYFLIPGTIFVILVLFFVPANESSGRIIYGEDSKSPKSMQPYVETIPGTTVKFELVPIPGGSYMMGSPRTEAKRLPDEGPQHEVTIRPFWMSTTEVTWNEYDLFAFSFDIKKKKKQGVDLSSQPESEKAADAVTRPTPPYADETFGLGREGQPVICITHHAAMEYCRWLSAKTGKIYRLPTEAEWEYACRAGTQTAYSFGDNPANLKEYAWYAENSGGKPQKIASLKPNPWGLFDMYGNAAEWVLDEYDPKFYSTFKEGNAVISPVSIPTAKQYPHVVRGGSWDDEAPMLRSAARRASNDDWSMLDPQQPKSIWWHTNATFVGFRVVRPLEEQENLKGLKSKVTKE